MIVDKKKRITLGKQAGSIFRFPHHYDIVKILALCFEDYLSPHEDSYYEAVDQLANPYAYAFEDFNRLITGAFNEPR
jgi:hypothetical protein